MCIRDRYGVIKDRQNKTVSVGAKALSAFVIFTVSGIIKGVIERDIMFVSILYALEGLVIFSLVYIFDRGILTIKAIDDKENIADDEGLSIIAVSYTHLDVYKRQGFGNSYYRAFRSDRD